MRHKGIQQNKREILDDFDLAYRRLAASASSVSLFLRRRCAFPFLFPESRFPRVCPVSLSLSLPFFLSFFSHSRMYIHTPQRFLYHRSLPSSFCLFSATLVTECFLRGSCSAACGCCRFSLTNPSCYLKAHATRPALYLALPPRDY